MAYLIVFGPLLAAIVAGLLQKQIGDRAAQIITTGLLILSAILSIVTFFDVAVGGNVRTLEIARWMAVGDFEVSWAIKLDTLSAVMLVVVTSVSSLVHVYSWGYMSHDPHRARFFAYLSLFTFAMLALVTADNFIQMFFGWEGVGLASYLLIGFWYKKESANAAAIKAFVTNRVGDFGLALGIMAIFFVFGSVQFDEVFAQAAGETGRQLRFLGLQFGALELIAFLLFIGAMGKSAQFFLHVWLPDAMEGPTPVSALIHAATMVTAGVFLVCRAHPIFELAPATSAFVTVIGATTALFAATVGLAQNDIKRVIAYSTCSQLGYMFFAAGLGLYSAAMFHLFTHAFFKALLFLCAGSVIHGLHEEQDMRKMGGTYQVLPWTWILMIIGTLALTGVGLPILGIGFAGFYSKDMIIEEAFMMGAAGVPFGTMAFWVGIIAAGLTSFYSWRLIFMTFHGKYRGDPEVLKHAHDSPPVMLVPLVLLAIGALFAGAAFKSDFVGKGALTFWGDSLPAGPYAEYNYGAGDAGDPLVSNAAGEAEHVDDAAVEAVAGDSGEAATTGSATAGEAAAEHGEAEEHGDGHGGHHPPTWVLFMPLIVTILGFLGAVWFYLMRPELPGRIAARGGPIHAFLSNKWYFDEIYHFVFVRGARGLGDLFWKIGDVRIIDGLGPNGVAGTVMAGARRIARMQTGYLYHYAFIMLIGVLGLTLWLVLRAGV
ncbi:NADH-quinone oxidoreductase subunit L [Marinicauda sp. Alg238-R41]|jgi:NADH-quinone oxidoreductase subunit L|uniref:NADH-quinone oxidoreductase subunit L n=1 Tax=Marinicauda sp. Alg238-R41 TaxID=2993447 RepID=UPI0022E1B934|nr:NADH-quinone oxidoreductase subunit L [Marinicauda sp. Alg238-R41]